jgi:hypothetical protein
LRDRAEAEPAQDPDRRMPDAVRGLLVDDYGIEWKR